LLTSSRQACAACWSASQFLGGGGVGGPDPGVAAVLRIVQERTREIGLLRAMGARPTISWPWCWPKPAMITGLGGLGGIVLGFAPALASARSLGFYFESLGVPVRLAYARRAGRPSRGPSSSPRRPSASCGALYPAWRARRLEPFALIHGEGAR
jgi:putative ABC transport system permease protein